MIIVRMKGRLGNQMFAYATSYALSRKYNEKLAVFKYEHDMVPSKRKNFSIRELKISCNRFYFGIPLSVYYTTTKHGISTRLNKYMKKNIEDNYKYYYKHIEAIYEDDSGEFAFENITLDKNYSKHIIEGYRQSPLYFDDYYDEIVAQFQPNYELGEESTHWQSEIENDDCAVSIHIRRGDYIGLNWSIPLDYYYKAIEIVKEKYPDATFYVFSDDIPWVKENLQNQECRIKYIEHHSDVKPFDDIWLMSKCSHNIIANSSYSWWGAYLNCNKEKLVIAPEKIKHTNNKDILPDSWIVI